MFVRGWQGHFPVQFLSLAPKEVYEISTMSIKILVAIQVLRMATVWYKNLLQVILASSCCIVKGVINVLIACCGEHKPRFLTFFLELWNLQQLPELDYDWGLCNWFPGLIGPGWSYILLGLYRWFNCFLESPKLRGDFMSQEEESFFTSCLPNQWVRIS